VAQVGIKFDQPGGGSGGVLKSPCPSLPLVDQYAGAGGRVECPCDGCFEQIAGGRSQQGPPFYSRFPAILGRRELGRAMQSKFAEVGSRSRSIRGNSSIRVKGARSMLLQMEWPRAPPNR